jgi:hypothetical protein
MKNHPLAELFPMMGDSEIQELSEDIKKNGLKNPIITYEGKILDGRNRYAACKLAFVEPDTEEYSGNNPLEYIVSLNLHRRHLSESQRGVIAGKIADLEAHRPEENNCADLRTSHISQPEAAKLLNVSRRSVQNVRRIMREAPEKIPEIESGKKTINKAMEEMKENKTSVEKKLGGGGGHNGHTFTYATCVSWWNSWITGEKRHSVKVKGMKELPIIKG